MPRNVGNANQSKTVASARTRKRVGKSRTMPTTTSACSESLHADDFDKIRDAREIRRIARK
jgi:hypothetical protein